MVGFLGVSILLVVGGVFLRLASKHGKQPHRFSIIALGAIVYLLGSIVGNRFISFLAPAEIEASTDYLVIAAFLIGIAFAAVLHSILDTLWSANKKVDLGEEIIDADFVQEN